MTGKEALKQVARGLTVLLVSPLILGYRLLLPVSRGDQLFTACSQCLSLLPGLTGSYLRMAFYRYTMQHCTTEGYIGFGVLFSHRDTELHHGLYIGPQCNIGLCSIGRDCLLGSGVHVLSGKNQHRFEDVDKPIRMQGGEFSKIALGENCWVGNGAIIMANIGRDSIVGAGSVVVEDVPPGSIVGGNPARVIRNRKLGSAEVRQA